MPGGSSAWFAYAILPSSAKVTVPTAGPPVMTSASARGTRPTTTPSSMRSALRSVFSTCAASVSTFSRSRVAAPWTAPTS